MKGDIIHLEGEPAGVVGGVRLAMGKSVEVVGLGELRALQRGVLTGSRNMTVRDTTLLDACISYVCENGEEVG